MENDTGLKLTVDTPNLNRDAIALECMKAMLLNPTVMNNGFETIADFAFRQADAFISKSKEPLI